MKTGLLLSAGLLLAILAACPLALAGQGDQFTAPNAASDDTPARRAPVTTATPDSKQILDPDPGGAIFNPLSQMPAAVGHPEVAAGASAPDDSSVSTTVVAALAGIAIFGYVLRKFLN